MKSTIHKCLNVSDNIRSKAKKMFFRSMLLLTMSTVFVTGCKKEKTEDVEDTDASAAENNALAEGTFNDVSNISDEANSGSLSSYKNEGEQQILSACVTITRDTVSNPRVLTIDFGDTNCLCLDDRYRRGKIIITHTGKYRDSATTWTTTFVDYFVNDNQVTGTRTGTNNGRNAAGNLSWTITVDGSIVLANGGGTITWISTRTREMTEGEGTAVWLDDMYSITGSASGTSAKGASYTMNITNPLIRDMSIGCRRHFTKGTFDLTPSGKLTRTIDFGDGSCDALATVTINGKTYPITLK